MKSDRTPLSQALRFRIRRVLVRLRRNEELFILAVIGACLLLILLHWR